MVMISIFSVLSDYILNILICLIYSDCNDQITSTLFPYFMNFACLFRGAGDVYACLLSAKAILAPQVTLKL